MNKVKKIIRQKEIFILGILLLLMLVMGALNPRFLTVSNFINILRSNSVLAVGAMGMLTIMLTGGIDISIAAIMTASALTAGRCMAYYNVGLAAAFVIAVVVGTALGLLNGFLIGKFNLPPIIITLGTKNLIEGAIYITTGGKVVNNAELPRSLQEFSALRLAGIPIQVVIMILLILFTWAILKYTMAGRSLMAYGGNPSSAACMGVKPLTVVLAAYGYAGAMAAIAGMLNTSIVISVSSTSFSGYEMDLIAALVVGGVSLAGGKGSPWGAFLGVIFMAVIVNGMTFAKISTYYQDAITGAVILFAVTIEALSVLKQQQKAVKIEVAGEKEGN